MLKNSYALDLDYNCYVVNSDFVRYILPDEEVNYILENKSSGDKEDNGNVILYDHKFLYLAPGDYIDKFRLSKGDKVNLLNDVGNIKISEITSENIRAISFLLHYASFLMSDYEEAEVVAYEAPMSVLYQRFPFSQRMFYFTEGAQFRKDDVDRTENELKEKISFDTQDKVSLSGEGNQGAGEDKSLNSLYEGLKGFGLGDEKKSNSNSNMVDNRGKFLGNFSEKFGNINQNSINNNTEREDVAIFCRIFGPEEEQKSSVVDVKNPDGSTTAIDTQLLADVASGLEGKPACEEAALDPAKGYVCIDVPYVAYQKQINMLEKMKRDATLNPDGYTICSKSGKAKDDDWIARRVQNWITFFYHKGLLFGEGKGEEGYQVGDVVFIKREGMPYPDHSAIVTKLDAQGKPVEFVVASYKYGKVMKFSLDKWQNYLKDIKGTVIAHGGFRNSITE